MTYKMMLSKINRNARRLCMERPRELCLTVLLVVQVCLILFSNLNLINQELDCDSAMVLKHIICMWQEGTPIIPDWAYLTTLEWDCTSLLAVPLYGLTGDIFVACSLSNLILLCLLISAIFFLFDGENKLYPLLCANLICIPYRIGQLDYFNMLFFSASQYIIKVTIPLLLVGVLLAKERSDLNSKKLRSIFFTILYLFLLLISTMSSNVYVAACGVVPVWASYIGLKFFKWEKVRLGSWLILGGTLLCIFTGFWVNNAIMGGTRATAMKFCSASSLSDNVRTGFIGMFELLGGFTGDTNVAVFSFWGLVMLGKICLVIVLLICGVLAMARCVKKQRDLRLILLLSIFLCNFFILNVTDTRYGFSFEYRYHLIGMLPLICVTVIIILNELFKLRSQQQRVLFLGGVLALIALAGASFRELNIRGERNAELKELVQYCENLEVDIVYMLQDGDSAEIGRALDGTHLYLELGFDGLTRAYNFYSCYQDAAMDTESAVVVVNDSSFDLGDYFSLADSILVKFDAVAGKSLYYFAAERSAGADKIKQ